MGTVKSACIGNFAFDCSEAPDQAVHALGGAGLRFVSGWAMFGLPIAVQAIIGPEPEWNETLSVLADNRVNIGGVVQSARTLGFVTKYNGDKQIAGFEIHNAELMNDLAALGDASRWADFDLVHICPFECEDQARLIARARSLGLQVSTMIHYSGLNKTSRCQYLDVLPSVDHLFLNCEEAQYLVGDVDWHKAGSVLSKTVRRLVFVTRDSRGAAAFEDGRLVAAVPPAGLAVRDLLGAGDCFAGGCLAGLVLSGDPLVALRCGSITAAFALADVGHTALTRFLKCRMLDHVAEQTIVMLGAQASCLAKSPD